MRAVGVIHVSLSLSLLSVFFFFFFGQVIFGASRRFSVVRVPLLLSGWCSGGGASYEGRYPEVRRLADADN